MFPVVFVCLFVCYQHYSKHYEWITMKFMEGSGVLTLTVPVTAIDVLRHFETG